MADIDPRLARLAELHNISTEFWDWKGQHHQPGAATLIACLRAVGVDVDRPDWIDHAFIEADEKPWRTALPDCVVVEAGQERLIDVHVRAGRPAHVWAQFEDGSTTVLDQVDNTVPDRMIGDEWVGRATFRVPTDAAPGYHTLFLESDDECWQTPFIVTPTWVGIPDAGHGRIWGFMTQLYSVYGETSWGVGDFVDLADLAVWAKTKLGADFILTNPTHVAEVIPPMQPSPYFPSTRRYVNPIYIRPEAIEEYATASQEVRDQVGRCRRQACAEAHASAEIRRDPVWQAKREALTAIFRAGRRPTRQMEFEEYMRAEGAMLHRFALWCVLTEAHGQSWKDWPVEFADPDSVAVRDFALNHSGEITFQMWLQWVADSQAKRAQRKATGVGMAIGVMADLAVGVNTAGEETWAMPSVFASGVTVGAPPDSYNQAGQDWRQPPWRPDRLREMAYAPLRAMFHTILNDAGAVRVDHILGLFRLWWIPEGMTAGEGAYIRYDHEATVGILALEAYRARTAVIGEDLGTVEPWVRDYLARRGILGTSVLWFEYGSDGRFLAPEEWRDVCLGSVTTHDLPPTLGYLAHDHVVLRHRLGLIGGSLDEEIGRDKAEQSVVMDMLVERGLMEAGETDPRVVMLALYRFLARTPAHLRCVALTDAVGDRRTQNQPGTVDEYPNWRVPLCDGTGRRVTLEQVFTMPSVRDVADIMNGKV
ncbi:MAG: 4-alpha-glucanotransferase [Propionibacteriaceae bacterium]|nr:4-alpha-glucanotransferase [Propionibacteriaceae bacterium]